jgi:hypothetical protein
MYSNQQFQNFLEKKKELREKEKHDHFQNWVKTDNNEEKLNILLNKVNTIIADSPYEFKDLNQFKDELATFIYKLTLNAKA